MSVKDSEDVAFKEAVRARPRAIRSRTLYVDAAFASSLIVVAALCAMVLRHGFPDPSLWPQGWLNPFDRGIEIYLNHFANRWPALSSALLFTQDHQMLKGGPIVLLCWIGFFERAGNAAEALERRQKIAATIPVAFLGVSLARVLAKVLPFRERPIRTAAIHFQLPHAVFPQTFYGWSAFPSDHAVLFVTLAVGLLMASRLLGTIALLDALAIICFPRMLAGYHWPTDILGGAVIGAMLAGIVAIKAYRHFVWRWSLKFWQRSPGIFAAFAFFLSFEIVELFDTPLTIALALAKHVLR